MKNSEDSTKKKITTKRGKNSWKKRPSKQEVKDALEFTKAMFSK